ncbi:MAG: hypothetical protein GX560_11265 [Deinococcales bacterium]|nr:hypothetical protein [Deinococcales bacterium]
MNSEAMTRLSLDHHQQLLTEAAANRAAKGARPPKQRAPWALARLAFSAPDPFARRPVQQPC